MIQPMSLGWIDETVSWLWGFQLEPFQREILEDLMSGGMYSVMLPTDHGKSTLIEIAVILGIIRDPQRANIVVKVSEEAAKDVARTICWQLMNASTRYPHCKPLVRWSKMKEQPEATGSFYVVGGDRENRNPTVFAGSIGSRDLQGRRGRTFIDDVETANEARSPAFRASLEDKVNATLRTLEPRPERLWAIFGTPYHEASVYFTVIEKLRDVGTQYKVIRRPIVDEFGVALWPARRDKVEIHRRTMSPTEWQVAYELKPIAFGKLDLEMAKATFDLNFPLCPTQKEATQFLKERHGLEHLTASWYIGYDPAARGDFAIVAVGICMSHLYVFRAYLQAGDIFDQIRILQDLTGQFPGATLVIEKNGQQQAFIDIIRERMPNVMVAEHNSRHIRDEEQIGIPALLDYVRSARFHLPAMDDGGLAMSRPVYEEIRAWPAGHPHLLPAIWFCSRREAIAGTMHSVSVQQAPTERPRVWQVEVTPVIRRRVQEAWSK
jgi:hypothetical protein